MATRVKAKVNYPDMGNTSGLLPSQGRGRASIITSLGITDRIARRGRGLRSHECPRYRDGSGLPVRLGKWCATIASSPDI